MIIGFDASRAFLEKRTGTENYSYQLLKHLAQIDHKNQYKVFLRPVVYKEGVARTGAPHAGAPALLGKWETRGAGKRQDPEVNWPNNFEFITIPYSRLWTQTGLARETFFQDLDILFIPSHTLPLIRKPKLKTVVTVHDLGAEFLPKTHQLKQRLYLKFMTNFQLKSASGLIAVSKETKDDLIKKIHINPDKISVIYEGYDKSLFKPLKNDAFIHILNHYGIENNNYFLFVGTIQPRKNLERLIKAYTIFLTERLRKTQKPKSQKIRMPDSLKFRSSDSPSNSESFRTPLLVLAGSKGWMSDEIYKLPKKLGVENQVKLLGYVPDNNLPALYNGAIALLFPSLFEGFGLPILEAMACGTPILTSNISSMPEITGKAAMLVNPYSEEQIAQGISRLFSDQILKNKLKRMGIAQSKKFSWEKCARQTLRTFKELDY